MERKAKNLLEPLTNLWEVESFLFTEAFQNDIFWFKWLNSSLCMPSLGLFTHQEQSKANPDSKPLCDASFVTVFRWKSGYFIEQNPLSNSSAACGHSCTDFTIQAKQMYSPIVSGEWMYDMLKLMYYNTCADLHSWIKMLFSWRCETIHSTQALFVYRYQKEKKLWDRVFSLRFLLFCRQRADFLQMPAHRKHQ